MTKEFPKVDLSDIQSDIKDIENRLFLTTGYYPGINCGNGWLHLIVQCHKELLAIDPDYKIGQIKEKFGGLRYNFSTKTELRDQMNNIVRKYEQQASVTCERTGTPGHLMISEKGWEATFNPEYAPEGYVDVPEEVMEATDMKVEG